MKEHLKIGFDGGSLYFALVLSVVFSTLSIALILFIEMSSAIQVATLLKRSLVWNARNTVEYLLCDSPTIEIGELSQFTLLPSKTDKISVMRQKWGMFELAGVEVSNRVDTLRRTMFIGRKFKDDHVALILSDQNRPLVMCGEAIVRGNCLLPEAGVKRGFIEGVAYARHVLIEGDVGVSGMRLPSIENLLDSSFHDFEHRVLSDTLEDKFESVNSFWNNQEVIRIATSNLKNAFWKGKVIIVSKRAITIDSTVVAEDVIFQAPIVRVLSGFEGSIQIFATDSIIVEKEVNLTYPTLLYLQKTSLANSAQIEIGHASKVSGAVLLNDPYSMYRSNALLTIQENAMVTGFVYSNNKVEINGSVSGTVYANKLSITTASSVYENHLFNASIDATSVDAHYVLPISLNSLGNRKIVKWLE